MTSSPRTNVLAYPAFASLKRGPSANNPALVAVRLHFAVRNRAGQSLPPLGATCSLPHFRFAQMWPRARTPALVAIRLHFAARNRAYGYRPHLLGLPRKIRRGISLRAPWAAVRFAAMASPPRTSIVPSPSRLCRAGSPTAKTRPLLPFGRISPAAKPRVRSSAPPFGFAAQNQARHFAARNHPVRLSASRP